MKTYIEHLLNWNRIKSIGWYLLAGIFATALYNLSSTSPLSWSWTDVKVAILSAITFQLTKALNNYLKQNPPMSQVVTDSVETTS